MTVEMPRRRQWPKVHVTPARAVVAVTLLILVVTPNVWLALRSIGVILAGRPAVDWNQYLDASRRFADGGDLYAVTATYGYHYSPFLAPVFGLLAPLGMVSWRFLHLAAAAALPTWPMRLLALASWPFWFDVEAGNLLIFVVLTAAWALRGSRLAGFLYLVLLVLIPRPLMIPVAVWLLWRNQNLRWPFAIVLMAHSAAVLLAGFGGPWLLAMLASSGDVANWSNVGPSRFIGSWWLLIGIPLAIWLTSRGRVGWASLAASPYWLPYYLLMPLLELTTRRGDHELATDAIARGSRREDG